MNTVLIPITRGGETLVDADIAESITSKVFLGSNKRYACIYHSGKEDTASPAHPERRCRPIG